MGTLGVNNKGFIVGSSQSSYGDAQLADSGTATDSPSGNVGAALQYFRNSGRGGGAFRFIRTFLHFNTSSISGGSSFTVQLTSIGANGGNAGAIMGLKHTAGNSNGGELANGDFDAIDRNTKYSATTAYTSSGTQTVALNAAAATQIINNNDFNIALLLTFDAEQAEEDPLEGDGNISNGIAFGSAINLVYTDAASGYSNNVAGLATANIGKVNLVATANISKVNNS